jgi:hypothetical protein
MNYQMYCRLCILRESGAKRRSIGSATNRDTPIQVLAIALPNDWCGKTAGLQLMLLRRYGLSTVDAVHHFTIGRHSAMHAYHEPSQATVPMHHSMTGQHIQNAIRAATNPSMLASWAVQIGEQ